MMKTKRNERIVSLLLTTVMLFSLFLPVYAEESGEKTAQVFAEVDFEKMTASGTSIDPASVGMSTVHPYVSIAEEEAHGKYAVVPFRGLSEDGKTGTGNFDKAFFINHPGVSYEQTRGVSIELDIKPGYLKIEGASDPTLQFQFKTATHDADLDGNTSTKWVSFGWINMRTGEFTTSATRLGAKGLVHGEWNKVRFDVDLASGTFDIFVNGALYATYGTLGNGNSPKNMILPENSLVIAKCNKNKGVYVDDMNVADTDMTYAAIDNVKFYENVDFVAPEPEPVVPYSIFNDSLQSKPLGAKPNHVGYSVSPNTALITSDVVDPTNRVVKVDFKGSGDADYYLLSSTNNGSEVLSNYTIADGVMTVTVKSGVKVTAPIWGDDESEKGTPTAAYAIAALADVKDNKNGKCDWFIVTGTYCDAQNGAGNVSKGLQPKHPAIASADYDTVVLNVDYYFSEDAAGKVEVQMKGTFALKADNNKRVTGVWIDVILFEAKKDSDTLSFVNTSNYILVCGSAPTVKKGEWFTLSAVFDMHTGYEDIYINGSYCFTQKPKATYKIDGNNVSEDDFEFYTIEADTLSVGKIQRKVLPEDLSGFYMIDNINFSTGEVLLGEQYEKTFIENFDDLAPDTKDFSGTSFANGIPSSVVLASEGTHDSALKLTVGEVMDEEQGSAPVLYRNDKSNVKTVHRVSRVNADGSVVLASGATVSRNADGKYTVEGDSNFVLGTYLEYVNFWAQYEDGTPAGNVDNTWTFHNPGISYATKTRVATDIEIFVPEGASGLVISQIRRGSAVNASGVKRNFDWLQLYTLDLATGKISIGTKATVGTDGRSMGVLNIGEWNTVSVAINMVSGIAELYVNNFYAGEASLGYTNIAFYENTWIPVKVSRRQDLKVNPLEGYVLIDDARFFTVTNQLVTVDANLENVTAVKFDGKVVPNGTKLFVTDDVPYETERFDTSEYEDVISEAYTSDYMVAVRSNTPIGLRFTSVVDLELLEELLEKHAGTVTFGTVILPTSAIATVDEFTRTELNLRGIEYLEIRTDEFYCDEYLEEDYGFDFEGVFAGSIVGLKEGNISRDFSAVGYVEVLLETGGSIVLYTEVMQANLATHAQNYLDELDDIPEDIRKVLEGFSLGRYPVGYVKEFPNR